MDDKDKDKRSIASGIAFLGGATAIAVAIGIISGAAWGLLAAGVALILTSIVTAA